MKIAIYSRPEINHRGEELSALFTAVTAAGFDYSVNTGFAETVRHLTDTEVPGSRIYDPQSPDLSGEYIAVSYGGDGTFLECVRLLGLRGLPVLGINSGRLGFLANVPKEEVGKAFAHLRAGDYKIKERALIDVRGELIAEPATRYAFNEFSVQRSGAGMVSVEAFVDGEMVGTFWGDGIMLSTPAGSTAYSLSVGGPVVAPGCSCFILSPIAPHNLTMRPVVVPDSSEVTFRLGTRKETALATLDSISCRAENGTVFKLRKATETVSIIELQDISFYDTLRNKMMWGFDRRDTDPE